MEVLEMGKSMSKKVCFFTAIMFTLVVHDALGKFENSTNKERILTFYFFDATSKTKKTISFKVSCEDMPIDSKTLSAEKTIFNAEVSAGLGISMLMTYKALDSTIEKSKQYFKISFCLDEASMERTITAYKKASAIKK